MDAPSLFLWGTPWVMSAQGVFRSTRPRPSTFSVWYVDGLGVLWLAVLCAVLVGMLN